MVQKHHPLPRPPLPDSRPCSPSRDTPAPPPPGPLDGPHGAAVPRPGRQGEVEVPIWQAGACVLVILSPDGLPGWGRPKNDKVASEGSI